MGLEEYVDLDLDEFHRRSNERLLGLLERARPVLTRDLGEGYEVQESAGRLYVFQQGQAMYHASATAAGRLLLTDISGRYAPRL